MHVPMCIRANTTRVEESVDELDESNPHLRSSSEDDDDDEPSEVSVDIATGIESIDRYW